MVDPKFAVTFSQYNEDVILSTLLNGVTKGFYVDVGANYPTIDSVTKRFYDNGWNGINIEPIKSLYNLLVKERPRDINMHCGIGSSPGRLNFREYVDVPGHSTFDEKQMEQNKGLAHKDYMVEIKTLKQIFNAENVKKINFLKIDVEGYELKVIQGNDWLKYRPEVVCIESNHLARESHPTLNKFGYKLFISDGLNQYFIAEERWSITDNFADRIVLADYHTLKQHQWQSWYKDNLDLQATLTQSNQLKESLTNTNQELEESAKLSFKDKRLIDRLKLAFYGVTIDWYRFKKTKK